MKRLLIISGIIVGVLLLVIIAVPLFINVDSFRPDLEKKISAALNRQVHIGKLDASLLSGGASASDITIADDPAFNKDPFLKAASVKVGVQLMPLIFSKQLKVTSLTIQKPDITLLKNAAGKWNYSTLGATAQRPRLNPQNRSLRNPIPRRPSLQGNPRQTYRLINSKSLTGPCAWAIAAATLPEKKAFTRM